MSLRKWQRKATEAAVSRFLAGHKIFVTEACPGAGKTRHGREVAATLWTGDHIDLTIILTPSIATRASWKKAFDEARREGIAINATSDTTFPLDSGAWVTTYCGYEAVKKALRNRPIYKGILLIADEYHHAEEDAHWGNALTELGNAAKHILKLSGTPWRRTGFIPMLQSSKNMEGVSYYQEGSTRVRADYVHDYSRDLNSKEDRATVPIEFKLFESIYTSADGAVEVLDKPDFSAMTAGQIDEWEKAALQGKPPLGKHLRASGPTLENNQLLRDILSWGFQRLKDSREQARRSCGQVDMTVMLVVAQSVKEARYLADYIAEVEGLRTQLIVSEDERSNEMLELIQRQCAENHPSKPDVIVSVGMISEGVDIPQIKVIAYCSAILTTLYLIQTMGRAQRRMFVPSLGRFADQSIYDTPAYFAAPAHPKICYVARKIEEQIEDAAISASTGEGGDPPPEPPTPVEPGSVSTTDVALTLFRGQEEGSRWREFIEYLQAHENAGRCFLNSSWCEYILGLALMGSKEAEEQAHRTVLQMCECLYPEQDAEVVFHDIWNRIAKSAGHELSYDQEQRLLRKQAQQLTNMIRWRHPRYRDIQENDRAFMMVRSDLNRAAGLVGSGFPKATLAEKKIWIERAQELLNEADRWQQGHSA